MNKVSVRPIEAFELVDDQGKAVAVVRVTDRWQGMARLATDDNQSLIVDDLNTYAAQFGKTFAQIFGGTDGRGTFSVDVIKASPDLALRLGWCASAPQTGKAPQ